MVEDEILQDLNEYLTYQSLLKALNEIGLDYFEVLNLITERNVDAKTQEDQRQIIEKDSKKCAILVNDTKEIIYLKTALQKIISKITKKN